MFQVIQLSIGLIFIGGMVAAMVIPALIIVTGFLLPAGAIGFDRLNTVLTNPIGRFVVFSEASQF